MCELSDSPGLAPKGQSLLRWRSAGSTSHFVFGRRTYGKGLIQSVYELSDSSGLVLTVGKYLTPARTDIDREGLQPDFRHPPPPYAAAERLAACRVPARA